jgi:pyridine nucleotide-disulfide oxidoreductase family protein
MMRKKTTLVLIGGGHSHAIALNFWRRKPLPEVELILITDVLDTPYSGMLPGYIAGFYSFKDTHINLGPLAQLAGAKLYLTKATGVDLEQKQVYSQDYPPIAFDYLSIDIGSTPTMDEIKGAKEWAIPIKPVPDFLKTWQQISETTPDSLTLAIVGGGAGGVELALNAQQRLLQIIPNNRLSLHLFHAGSCLLTNDPSWVSNRLQAICQTRGIKLHLDTRVKEVKPNQVVSEDGLTVDCDYIFWVTQASAPSWIKASGLKTDSQGFITISQTLQSLSHPFVFATGDIATMVEHPRPKAGVFAVRQGKPLWENWCRLLQGKPLKTYIPQKRYLSLIGTGDKKAIALWGNWGCQSPLFWLWKDSIDRSFMKQFPFYV